ncbi:aldo/keto reductase [Marinilactibacillus sp. XAAS-LB27]|uniref:aldo/keto reductase n=1 Tax=Marinilactibacillus sp. XAAS-LB27 TaxID=3114538 RepID=UPI002E187ACE|nr:aldo/keto reductase [Marinilactibacillus sp. XAAS-LB27]
MKTIKLGKSQLDVSEVALGCMRMNALDVKEATAVLEAANDSGINFYDHADIYGKGESEERFAAALKQSSLKRENFLIQSKAGIRFGKYDFSKEHLTSSVEGILKRLETDYLDVLLLHRPDALVEPEEVAEVFTSLQKAGKVKHFGVSNHSPYQIQLLEKYIEQDIVANQLQLSVTHTGMIDAGIHVNTKDANSVDHDRAILDYCRLNDITIQPWSPVQGEKGVFLNNPDYPEINEVLSKVGENYGMNNEATAIAWLLRHPAKMQVILGTMNPERIKTYASASGKVISRDEWYEIYRAAGNIVP